MEEKKIDRRVVKTKKSIRRAFITLLAQKDYNDISVKDIAETADVDRKTVYNYYSGIYSIREELENDLITSWSSAIGNLDIEKNIANPQQIFDKLTEIINGNFDLYSNLMKLDAKSNIVRKMVSSLTNLVKAELEKSSIFKESVKLEIVSRFITSGMLSAYQCWFNSERQLPLSELSKEIGEMVINGLKGLKNNA